MGRHIEGRESSTPQYPTSDKTASGATRISDIHSPESQWLGLGLDPEFPAQARHREAPHQGVGKHRSLGRDSKAKRGMEWGEPAPGELGGAGEGPLLSHQEENKRISFNTRQTAPPPCGVQDRENTGDTLAAQTST